MNQIQVTNRLNKATKFPLGHTNETVETTTGLGHISIVTRQCASTVSMECSVPLAPFNCQKGLHPRGTMAPAVNRLLCYSAKASAAHNSRVTVVCCTKDECPSQNANCDMSKAWSLCKCLHVREVNTSTLEETHFLGVLWTAGTQTWNVTWGVNNTPITFKLDNVTV